MRLRVRMAGIGRDELRELSGAASPLREPFASWPAVPGREILGRVVEVGPEVRALRPGSRVVVDPFLSCAARGFGDDPCPRCRRGLPSACARAGEEGRATVRDRPLLRGDRLGRHADLPGGWGEEVVAHEDQLLAVDPELPDRVAVLVEPVAAALHAVRVSGAGAANGTADGTADGVGPASPADPGALSPTRRADRPALVLGSGARALATVAGLRVAGHPGPVVLRGGGEAVAELGRRLGADRVPGDDGELRDAMAATGARAYMPLEGEEVWAGGGFDPVFEWTGTAVGLDRALRMAAPGGRVVAPGASAAPAPGLLELAVSRDVALVGASGYGPRVAGGPDDSTLPLAHALLRDAPGRWQSLVTHVYPLRQLREALDAAVGRGREEAVKVLLDPEA